MMKSAAKKHFQKYKTMIVVFLTIEAILLLSRTTASDKPQG